MTLPIYKKTISEKMSSRHLEIATEISKKDKEEISRIMKLFIRHRDIRGNWIIPRKHGLEMLPYFQKYVDAKVTTNIFGCGGCAKQMVDFMFNIYKVWQNPTR